MEGRVIEESMNGKMGMRIMVGLVPVLVVVVLWVTSKSSQFFLSTQLLGSPHFMFSIFNSIILLITVRHHEPSPHQQLEIMELLQSPYHKPHQDVEFRAHDEGEDKREDDDGNEDGSRYEKEDRGEDEIEQLTNEEEDGDDDDEDETERWDEEEEEEDEELEKRIEEFIAKVNKRWREEKLRDNLLIQICSSNVCI